MSTTRTSHFSSFLGAMAALVALVAAMAALLLIAYNASPARAAGDCSTNDDTTTRTFGPTGSEDTLKVPAGVSSVHVVATGAPGALGKSGRAAGRGARVSGDLKVSPGQTLYVNVGGTPTGNSNCEVGVACIGGFNGGGSSVIGGGGGGASDVRTVSRAQSASLASRLIVTAGGGGSGFGTFSSFTPTALGGSGGDAGSNGGDGDPCDSVDGATGGKAGGQNAGGAGGIPAGRDGSLGQGGGIGGGGGGGYYGGGWRGFLARGAIGGWGRRLQPGTTRRHRDPGR